MLHPEIVHSLQRDNFFDLAQQWSGEMFFSVRIEFSSCRCQISYQHLCARFLNFLLKLGTERKNSIQSLDSSFNVLLGADNRRNFLVDLLQNLCPEVDLALQNFAAPVVDGLALLVEEILNRSSSSEIKNCDEPGSP